MACDPGHRHNHAVAHDNVVPDMAVRENVVMRANHGRLAFSGGAMNGHAFADGVVVPDFRARDPSFPLQVLGPEPQAGERLDLVALAQAGVAIDDHVRNQPATFANDHVLANHAIRANFAVGADLGRRMDNRTRVDHTAAHGSLSTNVTSASLTTSSCTLQSPLAFPILPRILVNSTSMTNASPGRTG